MCKFHKWKFVFLLRYGFIHVWTNSQHDSWQFNFLLHAKWMTNVKQEDKYQTFRHFLSTYLHIFIQLCQLTCASLIWQEFKLSTAWPQYWKILCFFKARKVIMLSENKTYTWICTVKYIMKNLLLYNVFLYKSRDISQ